VLKSPPSPKRVGSVRSPARQKTEAGGTAQARTHSLLPLRLPPSPARGQAETKLRLGRGKESDPPAVPPWPPHVPVPAERHHPWTRVSGSLCAQCPIPKQAQARCNLPWNEQAALPGSRAALPPLSDPGAKPEPPHSPRLTAQLGRDLPTLLSSTFQTNPKLADAALGKRLTRLQKSSGAERAAGQQRSISGLGTSPGWVQGHRRCCRTSPDPGVALGTPPHRVQGQLCRMDLRLPRRGHSSPHA